MVDCVENMKNRGEDYLRSLEAELIKIQVFQRELPLCYELVSQAIEACKKRMKSENGVVDFFNVEQNQQRLESDCNSDQTSSDDGPVLEEFIPIKRRCSLSDESENATNSTIDQSGEKSDWLRSAQLWNQTPDPPLNKEQIVGVKKSCGAFKPFINDFIKPIIVHEKSPSSPIAIASATSSAGTNSAGSRKEEKESSDQGRKQRRCWSPELHRRFLNALQQLGGAHVATPKQIREFMKVDGLTNDEVKSHLQKYRLHTRRPSPGTNNINNDDQPTPLPGVLRGIWALPKQESAKLEAKTLGGIQSSRRCTSPASSSTRAIAPSPMC